jgi:hypothetical protein
VAAAISALALSRGAGATEPWFHVEGSSHCSAPAQELAAEIRSHVAGEPNAALQVKVTLSEAARAARGAAPTRAQIEVRLGAASLGVKRLEAATCAETIDGVVAVVALALSSGVLQQHIAPRSASTPAQLAPATGQVAALDQPVPLAQLAAMEAPAVDALSPPQVARGDADVSLLLLVAADRGTLTEPTVVVGAGAGLRLGPGELRSTLWYALPSEREEVAVAFERLRTDYVAGALGYCRDFAAGQWLSGCTGLELGLIRRARQLEAPDQPRTEQERIAARLAAAFGLTLAYRAALLEPAFDLSVQFPLLGGLAEARSFGLRAGLSAALRF